MPRLLLTALVVLLAPAALAQTCSTEWTGAVGDNFTAPENWTNGVPLPGAVGCMIAPGTYTVSLRDLDPATQQYGVVVVGSEGAGRQTLASTPEWGYPEVRFNSLLIRPNGGFDFYGGTIENGTAIANEGLFRFPGSSSTAFGTTQSGTATLTNTGTVEFDQNGFSFASIDGTLTNEAGGTIRLNGPRGWLLPGNTGRLINRGLITSTDGTDAEFNRVTVPTPLSFVNDGGRIEAAEGELQVSGLASMRLVGGTYHAGPGARLLFAVGGNELEGTLTGAPVGAVEFEFGSLGAQATGAGATWAFGGTGARWTRGMVKGAWRNEGLLLTAGTGSTIGSPADPATLTNTGRIEIAAAELSVAGAGSALINEAAGVVAFTSPGRRIFGYQNSQILNRGRIVAEAGPTSVDSNTGGPGAAAGILNDGGRFEATGGSLTINGSRTRLVGGTYVASAGNTFRLATTYLEANGVLAGEGEGTFQLRFQTSEAQVPGEDGVFAFGGAGLVVERGTFSGAWRNTGLFRLLPGDAVGFPATAAFVNAGTVEWAGGVDVIAGGVFANESGGTLALAADIGITRGGGLFVNRGLIVKTGGTGTTSFAPAVQNAAGGEIRAETGTLSFSTLTDEAGAVWAGTRRISPPVGFVVAGTIAPGNADDAPGTLTWGGALDVAPSFVLNLDVAGPDAGTGYDRLVVTGAATLGGMAALRKGLDYSPTVGTAFPGVLTATAVTGTFATETLDQGFSLVVGPTAVDAVVTSPVGAEDGPAGETGPAVFAVATLSSPSARPSVRVSLPEAAALLVEVYDVQGRRVARLAEGEHTAGVHALPVSSLPSGVYVARVVAEGPSGVERATTRLVVVR